jgi:hypothetical protein
MFKVADSYQHRGHHKCCNLVSQALTKMRNVFDHYYCCFKGGRNFSMLSAKGVSLRHSTAQHSTAQSALKQQHSQR